MNPDRMRKYNKRKKWPRWMVANQGWHTHMLLQRIREGKL